MEIARAWAMPSGNTFSIPPIRAIVERVTFGKETIVDPFANTSQYGTIRNDLNPDMPTQYHMDALEFLRGLGDGVADVVLYDPPYSLRQASEIYAAYGKGRLAHGVTNAGYWASVKDEVARVTRSQGCVVSFGWNSNGMGMGRGFELDEVLLVAHGGAHNDTIVTVESKAVTLFDFVERNTDER